MCVDTSAEAAVQRQVIQRQDCQALNLTSGVGCEKILTSPPHRNLINPFWEFQNGTQLKALFPSRCCLSLFPFPAPASPPEPAPCILRLCAQTKERPLASRLNPLLGSASKNSSHHPALSLNKGLNQHFILVNDENQQRKGLCAPCRFIGYKIWLQEILLTYKSLEIWGCVNFDHLVSFAVSENSCLPFWVRNIQHGFCKNGLLFKTTVPQGGSERED